MGRVDNVRKSDDAQFVIYQHVCCTEYRTVNTCSYFYVVFFSASCLFVFFFFFSSRRRHTRFDCDWSSCALPILISKASTGLRGCSRMKGGRKRASASWNGQ